MPTTYGGMVSCGLNNENMELKQRIIRNLEWANKRLGLQGKELDETQLEIIEFCLLHDLQQLTIPRVSCCICETPNPEKIHISDVSVSKIEVKTKVKLIRSVGRDEGMTHPNNVLSIGEIGVVEQISSEDFKGEYPLYYVNFGSAKGYNISRFYWLRPNEVQIYSH